MSVNDWVVEPDVPGWFAVVDPRLPPCESNNRGRIAQGFESREEAERYIAKVQPAWAILVLTEMLDAERDHDGSMTYGHGRALEFAIERLKREQAASA